MATLDQQDLNNIKAIVQAALSANNNAAAEAVWQRVGSTTETMGKKLGDVDTWSQNIAGAVGRIEDKLDDHTAAG